MITEYRTVKRSAFAEIIIDKSRFIGYAAPVATEEAAQSFIEEIKHKHKDATHNVPAYIIGLQGEVQRYSDDGEPSGTAGMPVLEVLKKENLSNVVIVVTRYFGGIKLGAGGLIRAYTKGAKIALEASQVVTQKLYQAVVVTIDYTLLGKVQNELIQNNFLIKKIDYDHLVHLEVYVELEMLVAFTKQITEWTNGKCEITEGQQEFLIKNP